MTTTEVLFETAALADSIKKAALIAPTTGHAFDRAAGLVLEVDSETEIVTLKATDTQSRYIEWLSPMEIKGPSAFIRIPSKMIAGVIGTLPIGSGRTVTLKKDKNTFHIISGRTKFKCSIITNEDYPDWGPYNTDDLTMVQNFGARLKQVAWAVSTGNDPPWNGVYVDGKILAATDRYRIATVPMEFEAIRDFSIPPTALTAILSDQGDIKVGMTDTQFYVMPDDHTQMQTTVCDLPYPNIHRVIRREYPEQLKINKDALIECIARSKHVITSNRTPLLKAWFGQEEVAFAVMEETALLGDVIDVPGYAKHKRFEVGFSHQNIISALSNCPNEMINLLYDPANKKANLYINGGSGYESWVATRRAGETEIKS